MKAPRAWLASALALAVTLVSGLARAELRPIDAPRVDRRAANVPQLPFEYAPGTDEAGLHFAYGLAARERVRQLIPRAAAMRKELSALLGREVLASIEIRVASLPTEMARLAPTDPKGVMPAVAFSDLGLVVLSLESPIAIEATDAEELLRHELAHVALDEAAGGKPLPRWLHEGFAIQFAGGASARRAEALLRAELRDRPLPISELDARLGDSTPDVLAEAEAAEATRFLMAGPKIERFHDLLRRVREGASFDDALRAAYATDLASLEPAFKKDLAKRYSFTPVLAGATFLWASLAAIVLVRRARSKRAEEARRRLARAELREARARLGLRAKSAESSSRSRAPIAIAIADPEVPKIEHDGRWYTLH